MEDLLLELLAFVVEAVFEYLVMALVDSLLRVFKEVFEPSETRSRGPALAGYALIGLALGCLSLLLFPHPLVHPSRIHGISLLVSPVIAGLMMSWMGAAFRRREMKVTNLESFGCGFAFAFGVALARFLLAK